MNRVYIFGWLFHRCRMGDKVISSSFCNGSDGKVMASRLKSLKSQTSNTTIHDRSDVITILHFNDVYNIESRKQEPVGGAARFATAIKQFAHLNPLILFSGDIFNPSSMSTITKGKQMVPILNALNVKYSVYGNHDFDFGVDTLYQLAQETTCKWLLSNVIDVTTDQPLANGIVSEIFEWQGRKIGIMGLVEEEWIDTLATLDPEDVVCLDFVDEGIRLAQELRSQGADYVIALTHMRWPNDIRLAENVPEIDLILGGHDHDFTIKKVNDKYIIKSGTDFRNLAKILLTFPETGNPEIEVQQIDIDSTFEEDQKVKDIVLQYSEIMSEKMETVIAHLDVELDGRFESIRTSETNLGNFITDIMLKATDADMALLNSGTLRSDRIHPRGEFKMRDLMDILPMIDPLVVIKISGEQVVQALENSVSKYPAHEGRFAQLSGVTFGFDPTKPSGQRVDPRHVKVQNEYIEMDRMYRLCTKSYIAEGRDGYDSFKQAELLTNADDGMSLVTAVQNHFDSVRILKGEVKPKFVHHQSIIALCRRKSICQQVSLDDPDYHCPLTSSPLSSALRRESLQQRHMSMQMSRSILARRCSITSVETEQTEAALAPEVEGRIFIVSEKNRLALDDSYLSSTVRHSTILESNESFESAQDVTSPIVSY